MFSFLSSLFLSIGSYDLLVKLDYELGSCLTVHSLYRSILGGDNRSSQCQTDSIAVFRGVGTFIEPFKQMGYILRIEACSGIFNFDLRIERGL